MVRLENTANFQTQSPNEVPTSEVITTEVPTTEEPTTEVPTTGVPTAEVPTTGVPTPQLSNASDECLFAKCDFRKKIVIHF
eukprot:TRINITY_DN2400_c0_g1_i1.p1 TRINITY_DN2400_c0_g1~~TRINITY_DN2400_c0_g1_i1.p1  ORF type:complete len:81 (-),score=15.05 TRINITY_DN2400_c0_g1_i1:121-363(-)